MFFDVRTYLQKKFQNHMYLLMFYCWSVQAQERDFFGHCGLLSSTPHIGQNNVKLSVKY